MNVLFTEFSRIARQHHYEPSWTQLPLDLSFNPLTKLTDSFWKQFVQNPLQPSDSMVKEILSLTKSQGNPLSLGNIFPTPCMNCELLEEEFLAEHVHQVAQRSLEWKRLLKFYQCGRNTAMFANSSTTSHEDADDITISHHEQWLRQYWHLIRGCVGELLVMQCVDFSVHPDIGPCHKVCH